VTWAALRAALTPRHPPRGQSQRSPGPSKWVYLAYYQNARRMLFATPQLPSIPCQNLGREEPRAGHWLKARMRFRQLRNKARLAARRSRSRPALLKADRAYQIAAAEFYAAQFVQARKAFEPSDRTLRPLGAALPATGRTLLVGRHLMMAAAIPRGDGRLRTQNHAPGRRLTSIPSQRQASGISPRPSRTSSTLSASAPAAARVHELGAALPARIRSNYRQHLRDITGI